VLILTRKQNESVIIDGDNKITVLSTKGQDVKTGIEAPDDVEIWREEIYDRMDHEIWGTVRVRAVSLNGSCE
jgi:carbon storage regulator